MSDLIQNVHYSTDTQQKSAHYHDCHQIILVTAGNVQFCINDTVYDAKPGSLIIISRYENHSVNVLSECYERFVLHIDHRLSSLESRVYSLLMNRPDGFLNAIDVSDNLSEFKDMFRRIIKEFISQQKLCNNMQQLMINELFIMIYRHLPDTSYFDVDSPGMVYSVQCELEKNYGKQHTLNALAKQFNMSPSSLSHQFKALTGSSVMKYLLSCRIAMAKSYLSKTSLEICEIVEKCGFTDSSNFSRKFKELCGISPSDFRKKYYSE